MSPEMAHVNVTGFPSYVQVNVYLSAACIGLCPRKGIYVALLATESLCEVPKSREVISGVCRLASVL